MENFALGIIHTNNPVQTRRKSSGYANLDVMTGSH